MNSQIILPAKKLTNSERRARDGGRHNEERCIFEAQTTAPEGLHAIICLMQIGTLWWNGVATIFINDKKHPKRPLLTQIRVDSFRTLCRPNDKSCPYLPLIHLIINNTLTKLTNDYYARRFLSWKPMTEVSGFSQSQLVMRPVDTFQNQCRNCFFLFRF